MVRDDYYGTVIFHATFICTTFFCTKSGYFFPYYILYISIKRTGLLAYHCIAFAFFPFHFILNFLLIKIHHFNLFLLKLVSNYNNSDLGDFVLGIAYNMTQIKSHRRQRRQTTPLEEEPCPRKRKQNDDEVQHCSKRSRQDVDDSELQCTQIIPPDEFAPQYSTAPVTRKRKKKTYDFANVRRSTRNK